MDVLISVDMEGVAGVATPGQVRPGGSDYQTGRLLMTREANAAVAGAFDAGATRVVVNDSHGPMDNLLGEELDPRVEYVVGAWKPLSMMQGLSADTDVALLVGYHAGPDEARGVLAHTFSGRAFGSISLNGEPLTETHLNALVASPLGVPVGLVTGDDTTCALAEKLLADVVTVPVKTSLSVLAAQSLHPSAAREAIRTGAAAAVERARVGTVRPLPLPPRLVVEADLRPWGAAELVAKVPGTERVGAQRVRREMADPQEMLDVIDVWASLAGAFEP